MKALFVRIKEGHREIHWPKLSAFALGALVLTTALVEGLAWMMTGHPSFGGLVIGLVVGTLLVVRIIVRAVTYQEQELELEAPVESS